ncbi:MAG: ABC transporter permease [Candidatus Aenigmatarchaeota archaeon]
MSFEAIYTVWLREMIRYFRQKERIIGSLVMPLFWLVVFGSSMRPSVDIGNLDYRTFISPGVIMMTVVFTSVSSGISIIWDKELGFMKEMLVAPVSRISIVLGKSLGTATTALIQGMLIMFISMLIGLNVSFYTILLMIPIILFISLGLVGIGITLGSLMNNIEGFQLLFNFLVMPLVFLSGALFPINNLPPYLKFIPYIDPVTYGVELLRYILIGYSTIPFYISLAVVLVFSTSMLFISTLAFKRKA